jgi:hypothetical protein
VALLILHKHAKVRVEDPAEQKHEKLLPNTTIILTLFIGKYDLGGEREGGRERARAREREREREIITCTATLW